MAFPKGKKRILGECEQCGAIGNFLRPDICSKCIKEEDRTPHPTDLKRYLSNRVETVRRKFKALPKPEQAFLLQEFIDSAGELVGF